MFSLHPYLGRHKTHKAGMYDKNFGTNIMCYEFFPRTQVFFCVCYWFFFIRPLGGNDLGDIRRYYAWDYRVLKTFAKHYSTGEVIPEKLVESMNGAKKMFTATELQRQVWTPLYVHMI